MITSVPARIRFTRTQGARQFSSELQAIAESLLQQILGDRPIEEISNSEIEEYRAAIIDLAARIKSASFCTEDNAIVLVPITMGDRFLLDIDCNILLNSIDYIGLAVYLGSPMAGNLAAYLGY